MLTRETIAVPPATLLALHEYLQLTDSKLSLQQAVVLAIREWLSNSGESATGDQAALLRGYQWKSLFLPHDTRLRMIYKDTSYYAQVVGDAIVYQGHAVSPRGFTMTIAGAGRNAWRDVFLRFPESRRWKRANICRIEQKKLAERPAPSPVETMTAAAAAMSDALKSALMLVERTNAESVSKFERRLAPTRRDADRVHEDCAFDT